MPADFCQRCTSKGTPAAAQQACLTCYTNVIQAQGMHAVVDDLPCDRCNGVADAPGQVSFEYGHTLFSSTWEVPLHCYDGVITDGNKWVQLMV